MNPMTSTLERAAIPPARTVDLILVTTGNYAAPMPDQNRAGRSVDIAGTTTVRSAMLNRAGGQPAVTSVARIPLPTSPGLQAIS